MPLTGNQRRYLRALGHHLSPVVQVGHQGATEGVIGALAQALQDHELVKVKLAQAVEDRPEVAEALATGTGGTCVQVLGRTLLIYLPRPEKPTIKLPAPRRPQPGEKPEADDVDDVDDEPGEE